MLSVLQKDRFYYNFYFSDCIFSAFPKLLFYSIYKLREESCFNAESPSTIALPPSGPKLLFYPISKFREESFFKDESPSPIALPPSWS